jgi:Serine phosphatase RsbU, regulator of sigma subunit
MKKQFFERWVEDQYRKVIIIFCILIIIFHPLFYLLLQMLPNVAPEPFLNRLVAVLVAVFSLLIVFFAPKQSYRYSTVQLINAVVAIVVTHISVFYSDNNPLYLAASLTAIYGAQLVFVRAREWLITMALVALCFASISLYRNDYADIIGYVVLLFYVANYTIATTLVILRQKIQEREIESQFALHQSNAELRQITEQLQNELALARDIQRGLLPPAAPRWPRLDVVCYSQPAREVGGDFYSYHRFTDDRIALAVGDVSGKGVSAALLMAASISLLNEHIPSQNRPEELLAQLDRSLQPYTQLQRQNCALTYIELNRDTLFAVNAGGIMPYIRRANGQVEELDVGGFALGYGLGAQNGYRTQSCTLASGDMVLLVSDGVVEAKNSRNSLFSFERIERVFASGPASSAQAMLAHVLQAIQQFVDALEPHDDLTVVILRVANE